MAIYHYLEKAHSMENYKGKRTFKIRKDLGAIYRPTYKFSKSEDHFFLLKSFYISIV